QARPVTLPRMGRPLRIAEPGGVHRTLNRRKLLLKDGDEGVRGRTSSPVLFVPMGSNRVGPESPPFVARREPGPPQRTKLKSLGASNRACQPAVWAWHAGTRASQAGVTPFPCSGPRPAGRSDACGAAPDGQSVAAGGADGIIRLRPTPGRVRPAKGGHSCLPVHLFTLRRRYTVGIEFATCSERENAGRGQVFSGRAFPWCRPRESGERQRLPPSSTRRSSHEVPTPARAGWGAGAGGPAGRARPRP